jgi:hypothetical protein
MLTETYGSLFPQSSFCHIHTFTGNAIDTLCRLLRISFRPGFHEWTPKSVFSSEDRLYLFPMSLNISETPFTYGICTEPRCFTSLLWRLLPFDFIIVSLCPCFTTIFYCIFSCYISGTRPGVRCCCYMAWAVQWLMSALSKGSNRVSPSPRLGTEIEPVSETLCFIVFRNPEDEQSI